MGHSPTQLPISAVILTYNEENNIKDCIDSIHGLVEEIFVVDSYSTDSTLQIARKYTDKIYQHPFENYSLQRNWALANLPFAGEWVMNLDADHRVSQELAAELQMLFSQGVNKEIKGFLISRKTIFLGHWIKHGGRYPIYHAFFFRKGCGKCEDRQYDQHFIVYGQMQKLHGTIEDIIGDSLSRFIDRHNRWADLEANEQLPLRADKAKDILTANFFGNEMHRRRFFRNLYHRFPLFIRPFLYFSYRYFLQLGFLDGRAGLIYHFLQGFWYRFLVDAKIYELQRRKRCTH